MVSEFEARIRNVTAVLGPTNTGKTHLAIERMLGHESGMIGLPLRLLAREVYDKIKARIGADKVALITGEEKIKPERARYWISTVEAMPRDIDVDFLAIDEIQLCADPERGHVFTDRLLHARGRSETLLLGSQTMREAINDVIPGANFISRPRLSKLTYSGEKKITRLPARTAIIAFSAQDVYAIAELIRRQRGGAAVVLGALSPRTRNSQVALYQSGDVEFLVATDAVGMGLNLDVDHVAFSALRKFDGQNHRNLTPSEIGQIAGRAGRHMNDGTFGVTGGAEPLDPELVERLETHSFDSVKVLQWRNRKLDFSTLDNLHASMREYPREARLTRARTADDVAALEAVSNDAEVRAIATTSAAVSKLWDVCQVPDYRKISAQSHAELIATLYKYVAAGSCRIPEDWFAKQVALADRTDGDIDTLANRIAHIRTWTFVSNRPDWLKDPAHWQERTRAIEDSLSDALHECLTQRFVDRRTSALMKGMRDKDELHADIAEDGSVTVESHFVGRLKGLCFTLDAADDGIHGKATRAAAGQVVTRELGMRARRIAAAQNDAFKLMRTGRIVWRDDEIAKLDATEDPLAPAVTIIADEQLAESDKEKILARVQQWLKDHIADKLKPLYDMSQATDLQGLARGVAFRLKENLGALKRETVADEINALDQTARADLRKFTLRFGAFNIYFPLLLKPAAADTAATLWLLKNGSLSEGATPPQLPRPGLTSVAADANVPEALYRANGFHVCGPRAVRLDILERLADLIRPLLAYRSSPDKLEAPPKGSTGDGGFKTTDEMMSILGCSAEELGNVLRALGFRSEKRPIAAKAAEPVAEAAGAASAEAGKDHGAAQSEAPSHVQPSDAEAPPAQETSAETASAEATVDAHAETSAETLAVSAEGPTAAETSPAPSLVEVASEPQFEEVWRPRRYQRPERPERPADNQRQRRDRSRYRRPEGQQATPEAQAATAMAGSASASGEPGQSADAAATGARAEHERKFDRPQHRGGNKDRNRDRRPEGGPGSRDASKDASRDSSRDKSGGQRDKGARDKGPRDKGRREDFRRQPEVISAAPPKRQGIDPDSPFAALAALKASLDKRGQG